MGPSSVSSSTSQQVKILVIDDDIHFQFGIKRLLVRAGYEVITAVTGIEGIQKAHIDKPTLILLDVNLPRLDGFRVKLMLNRFPLTRDIPVVFVSAMSDREHVLNGLNLGDEYIEKPFDPLVLVARLQKILQRATSQPEVESPGPIYDNVTSEVLHMWGHAVELIDNGTAGHTMRVANMAAALARSLGLGEKEVDVIFKSSMLHDIGKLSLPSTLLNKPGPLDIHEISMVREHPRLAYEMLAPVTALRPYLDILYFHHEHWDGSGYPNHVSGPDIPLAARIFSVVDMYDVLLTARPYKPAMDPDTALEVLRSQAGWKLDPRVVSKFLAERAYHKK